MAKATTSLEKIAAIMSDDSYTPEEKMFLVAKAAESYTTTNKAEVKAMKKNPPRSKFAIKL